MNARLIAVAIVLAGAGTVALVLSSGGSGPGASPSPTPSSGPSCLPAPTRPKTAAFPKWIPKDLPFPDGSYLLESLPTVQGVSRALLVVNASLDEFVRVVLEQWPKEGWALGPGEREPGEAEDTFYRDTQYGQFRAVAVYCDPRVLQVFLVMGKSPFTLTPNPTPSGSIGPLRTPSPSP